MDTYNVTRSLSMYKKELSSDDQSNYNKKNNTGEKTNKLTDITFSHILHTSEEYKKKMNKSMKSFVTQTFNTHTEFNDFIDNESTATKKKLSWKQMPVNWKLDLCKTFMKSDSSLNTDDVVNHTRKLCENKDLFKYVTYDKKTATILKIDYSYLN